MAVLLPRAASIARSASAAALLTVSLTLLPLLPLLTWARCGTLALPLRRLTLALRVRLCHTLSGGVRIGGRALLPVALAVAAAVAISAAAGCVAISIPAISVPAISIASISIAAIPAMVAATGAMLPALAVAMLTPRWPLSIADVGGFRRRGRCAAAAE